VDSDKADQAEGAYVARAFTFIHAADLHLDAPFAGVDATDSRVSDALVASTYDAFERIVSVAQERRVDFVLVSGDAFNSRNKSYRAQSRFRGTCERLDRAGIPIYFVQGNHDPADGWSANLPMPANVHYFGTDAVERFVVSDPESGEALCALYGRGYATAATRTNLVRGFERDSADVTAIGVVHANVGGQEDYEPYAPCSLDDLRAANMDYWALGHIHKPMLLQENPPIRYAGSPQGLNPKEDGPHGCWLVTMEAGAVTEQEFVETSVVRWAGSALDVSGAVDLDEVATQLRDVCQRSRHEADGRPVIIRIDLTGRTAAHVELARGTTFAELVAELRDEQLGETPWVWVDRVRDRTGAVLDVEFLRGVEDFTGDLVRIADDLLAEPEAASALIQEALGGIDGAFGVRSRDERLLIERARDVCLDRMIGGEDR